MVMMSQKEFQRVKVIENAVGGRLSVSEAARLLQLSERQVQRLKQRYRPDSIAWGAARQPWASDAMGLAHSAAAIDLGVSSWQVCRFQRFPSLRETSGGGEPNSQPRDRAPHLAGCQTGFSPKATPRKLGRLHRRLDRSSRTV